MAYSQDYFASHYLDVCRIAMKASKLMAAHGAEAYRIEDTAVRLLKTTGFSFTEAHSSVTGLIISLDDPSLDHEVTLVSRIGDRSNNLSKISLTNDLSRRFVAGELSIEEAEKELDGIQTTSYYSNLIFIPCYGLASALFTFMFGGWPLDAASSFLLGLLVGITAILLKKIQVSEFVRLFIASVILGVGFFLLYTLLGLGTHAGPILFGAIMPLVPGMLITVSIRDLLNGDYLSGMARIVEAFLVAIAIAAGVSMVLHITERSFGPLDLATPVSFITIGSNWFIPLENLFQLLCGILSSYSFVILFCPEPRHLLTCALCGGATWFVNILCLHYGLSSPTAIFLAALTASILSFYCARSLKTPVTVFFTGSILCLVPGAGMFQTMYYFIGRDVAAGALSLLSTLEISGLIAVALLIHSTTVRIIQHLQKSHKVHKK